jgi:hypothetical protein
MQLMARPAADAKVVGRCGRGLPEEEMSETLEDPSSIGSSYPIDERWDNNC